MWETRGWERLHVPLVLEGDHKPRHMVGLMMLKYQPHPAKTLGYLLPNSKETVSGELHESKAVRDAAC